MKTESQTTVTDNVRSQQLLLFDFVLIKRQTTVTEDLNSQLLLLFAFRVRMKQKRSESWAQKVDKYSMTSLSRQNADQGVSGLYINSIG